MRFDEEGRGSLLCEVNKKAARSRVYYISIYISIFSLCLSLSLFSFFLNSLWGGKLSPWPQPATPVSAHPLQAGTPRNAPLRGSCPWRTQGASSWVSPTFSRVAPCKLGDSPPKTTALRLPPRSSPDSQKVNCIPLLILTNNRTMEETWNI